MCSRIWTGKSTEGCLELREALEDVEAVLIGAGADEYEPSGGRYFCRG